MNQDSFLKPESYSPIPEEEKKQLLGSEPEMAFEGSDSDFKRSPSEKIDELGISNPLQRSSVSGVTPQKKLTNLISSSQINTSKKKSDELHFEFTVGMRFQIITYHLVEPVLVACLVGTCLNMPQLETLCVIFVSMVLYFPLLLSGVPTRIKVKMIASMISLAFVFLYLIFKLVMYFMEYPSFVNNTYRTNFLGIFFGEWVKTFVIDMVLLVLIGLLLWNQISQLEQCKLGIALDKKISKQIKIKFLHPVFGESLFVFYTISYLVFLIDTFFYQSFVQLAILLAQLIQCYMWTVRVEVSIKARKLTLRTMQVVTFLTLSVAFMFSMPYIFNGFLDNPDNARLVELIGYIQLANMPQWLWRVHIILLASAIVLSEVFFVADTIHQKSPMRVQGKVEEQGSLMQRGLVQYFKTNVEKEKKINFRLTLEKLWTILKSPMILWIARTCCFVWVYMYHDYQSVIVLIWLIHSTLYVKSTLFVKCTAYFYLPIFNLLVLWYFTTNVFGLILWQNFSQEQTIQWYRYGFYNMKIPPLEFGFMFVTLFIISFYCRQNFEKADTGIKASLIIEDLSKNKSTIWQIIYLIVLYLEYPLFLAMVMSGLAKMDFYHIFLLFIFVAYTLFPKFFVKNSIFLLIYANFFVLTKYVWTLTTNTSEKPGWLQIIGISSDYDPQSTHEYFRYSPKFDQWLLVLLTFCLYRRSNLVGTDFNKIKAKEHECIKDLYYKSPATKKVFTTIDILINHCIIIFTFLLFLMILVFMRRSFLNLVSLTLVLTVICTYMSRGIKKLNYFWNILTFYQAFVLLSILVYQFIFQSGISKQQWFISHTSQISFRVDAFMFWAGYYIFPSPIWYHFFPYVILFSFAVSIRHRFRLKQEMENLEIVLPEEIVVDNLLYSRDDIGRQSEQSEQREASLHNSSISGVFRSSLTRQEAEGLLSDYQIQLQENYFNMLYQIQYPIWKSRAVWPVFTYISRYFNFLLSVVIFCFSLYYQIALIWLIFLIIYLMQAWSTSNLHNKYMVEQFNMFRPTRATRNATVLQDDSTASIQVEPKKVYVLTEQEVLREYDNFNINVHKTSLISRHVFWLSQFVLVIVSIFFVYLSDFVTTTFFDPVSGKSMSLIQNVDTQNKTLFLYFWSGFLRQVPKIESSITDQTGLIQVYYPFFVLIFLLIVEKLSQLWLIDKFGTTEQVIKKWEKIEERYNENFKDEDFKSQITTIKDKSRGKRFSMKITSINGREKPSSPLNFTQSRSTFQQTSFLGNLPKHLSESAINPSSARPKLLLDIDAIQDEIAHRPVSMVESEFIEIEDFEVQKESVFNSFDPKAKASSEEMIEILTPMLSVKSKVIMHKSLKICFEEFIILLLWFSCIYKQSIFSFAIFFVLAYHTFQKSQRNSDKPMLLVRYTVVFILICEYSLFLTNLTSYNSPTPFPEALTPPVTVEGVVQASPYPSWNSTTNQAEFYYFYIPLYFAMPIAKKSTPPSVNVNLVTYFSIFVSQDQQNGMWFDFIITLLVVFYLDSCNFFILTKKIKVVSSEQCETEILKYQQIMKYHKKTPKEVKKELSVMIGQNRFVDFWAKWLYTDFILVMIAFVIIISIYSRTLLSYGYFLFCMILIFQSRKFFVTENSHKIQKNLLRKGLLPYLLLDIFLSLIYQLPINVFSDNLKWPQIVGFETYWISSPEILPLGYEGDVTTSLAHPLTPLYLKGIAYLCIMIQLAIIESRGFRDFKKKFTNENLENNQLIGKGIAYRFNNFKSKKILKSAKSFSELQKMLLDVKTLIMRREKMFKAQQTLIREGKLPKRKANDMLSQIEEEPQVKEPPKKDLKTEFDREAKREIELRMKQFNVLEKLYLWLRRNFVHDILFKHSKNHLIEIVNDFQNGRTCEKSNLERGINIQVKKDLLERIKDDLDEENNARGIRMSHLKDEVDADTYNLSLKAEQEKAQQQRFDYLNFRNKQLSSMQLKPWQNIDIETFQSWKTLGFSYLNLIYKIVASYTEWICYIFMLSATYSNGGLLYMVYPLMIFGYALLEESKPGSTFWFFTIIYTQIIILVQFTVQLTVWTYYLTDQTKSLYLWTQTWNLGLVHLPVFTFLNCLYQFLPEILIVMSVLVHIQAETLEGVFDKPPYIFESFEDGLRRYRLNINKDDTDTCEELKKLFQVESVIRQDLEFDNNLKHILRKRSRSFDSREFSVMQREEINYPVLKSHTQIFESLHVPERTNSMDCLFEHRDKEKQTAIQQLKDKITVLWNNGFFQRLFPQIKQQKPGRDYYVWTTLISFILCVYIILFFTQMSGQKTTLADQYSSNMFQAYMVITLFVMIAIMVIDRIMYASHAQLNKNEKLPEIAKKTQNVQSSSEQPLQRRATAENPLLRSITTDLRSPRGSSASLPAFERRPTYGMQSMITDQSKTQIVEEKSQNLSQSEAIDEDEEVLKMKAYEEALTPVIRQKSWKRILKVYYFWLVLILVHWFVFFAMPNQTKYCEAVANSATRAFCNKFRNNPALICFYTLFVLYFILQAFQLQVGMPELRKGGFMVGQYGTVSKTIFTVWYYIPFLFELRSIIDWTFSETALDIFQWLKLAQVQANMYLAKCVNRSYREKELGKKIKVPEKIALGCGLMVLILTLIAGPMLLFSSINPVSSGNSVSGGSLLFTLMIENTAQQTTYNVVLFQTTQVTSLQNLTQSEYNNLEFGDYSTTTAIFYPYQVQALEFAESSDTVWIVSQPTRAIILQALEQVQNQVPGVSITAQLTSTFERPSGSVKYKQTLELTNQTQPQIIGTLIDQIQCLNPSPIVNAFPVDMVVITVNCGSFASPLQSTYVSGFDLNYNCDNANPSTNYWSLNQTFPSNTNATISQEYDQLFPDDGFGFFTFSQNTLPQFLATYSSSILIFYATIVYVVASSLRQGLVPSSYQIPITDAPLTEDILMICTSIHIYRMQRDLEQEEELYFILIDIMRSPEMIKELSKSSLKGPKPVDSIKQQ